VHWVGVWDTVESVGLPGPLARSNPSTATLANKRIRHVRQALALDEHRWTFEPRLYDVTDDIDDGNQSFRQRWYPGVHCDVGGGYHFSEAGLSEQTLRWMVDELAADIGVPPLENSGGAFKRHDALWDTPWWALAGMKLRDKQPRTSKGEPIVIRPGNSPPGPIASIWEESRRPWPIVAAIVAGLFALVASGLALSGHWYGDGMLSQIARAPSVASDFAGRQFSSLLGSGHGFFQGGSLPWQLPGQVGWAMFWDLCFIAAWGYLLARVASRAFAWLAAGGGQSSRQTTLVDTWLCASGGCKRRRRREPLGMARTGAALDRTDVVACFVLWLGAVCALVKWVGVLACPAARRCARLDRDRGAALAIPGPTARNLTAIGAACHP
jgi:hypothetical protein